VKNGLSGLDGSKDVKEDSFRGGKGTYVVTIDASRKVSYKDVADACTFDLDRAEITISGDVEKTDKGYCLTAKSGAKFALKNREKKKDEKEAPNVTGKIDELLKNGKAIKVNGALTADKDGNQHVALESAEAVKAEKK